MARVGLVHIEPSKTQVSELSIPPNTLDVPPNITTPDPSVAIA